MTTTLLISAVTLAAGCTRYEPVPPFDVAEWAAGDCVVVGGAVLGVVLADGTVATPIGGRPDGAVQEDGTVLMPAGPDGALELVLEPATSRAVCP